MASAHSFSLRASIHDLIDDTAVEATHLVFASLDDPAARRVSFHQFRQWYNVTGYMVITWLELLDLKKWPFPGAAPQPAQPAQQQASARAPSTWTSVAVSPLSFPPPPHLPLAWLPRGVLV